MSKSIPALLVLLAMALGAPGALFAQEAPSPGNLPLRLTIDKAIELALAHNEQILIADEAIAEAQGVYREYAADAFPQLSGSVTYNRNLERMYTEQDMTFLNPLFAQFQLPQLGVEKVYLSNSHEWDFRLTLTQNIFTFGKVSNALALGDISRDLAHQGKKVAVQDVIVQTKRSFLGVLFSQEVLSVTQSNLERTEALYKIIKAKTDQGVMSRFDLLIAEAELAAAKPPVLEAQNQVNLATQALLNQIGEPLDRPVTIVGDLEFSTLGDDAAQLISQAKLKRPELRLLQMQEEMYDRSYRIFRSMYLPTLAANASASRTGGTDKQIFPEEPEDELQPTLSFGVTLYVPLFDGLRSYGQMGQMKAKKRTVHLQYQQLVRGVELEVTSLVSQIQVAEQIYLANQESYRVAKRAYELAELRLDNGLGTRLEVTDAKANLNGAMLGIANSLYNLNVARANLTRALGE